jgi:hypothetical protein
MAITDTRFGTITIDGETYEHDVVVRLSGLAVLSTDAAAHLEAKGCEVTAQLIPKAIQAFNAPRRARLGCFT